MSSELVMYAIYDKAVKDYMRPFFFRADGEAIRAFIDDVNSPDSVMNKHPEDYTLFRVGRWYSFDGTLVPEEPVRLARAHEMIEVNTVRSDFTGREIPFDPRLTNGNYGGERPVDLKADAEDRDNA